MNFTFDVLSSTRNSLKRILEKTSLDDLNKIPNGFNNNIIWNIGHIVVSEQLLVYKLSNLPSMLSDDMINKYRKGTKPDTPVNQEEVDSINKLLFATIEKTKMDLTKGVFKEYNAYTVSTTGNTLTNVEEALQFALFHEGLHLGYILAQLKAIKS